MILKSSQRAGAKSLANHLMNSRDNEEVTVTAMRGLIADDIHSALDDLEDFSQVSACQKHFYHVSLNPDRPLAEGDWQQAWTLYEIEFGLRDQPYIEVTHKKEGRLHKHRVYERVTLDGTAIQLSFTRIRNEKIARILEYELDHPLTIGKHNRAVIKRLREEGLQEVAQWMEQGHAHDQTRPVAQANTQDQQQEKRTKIPLAQVKADLQKAYQQTDSGSAFEAAIIAQGYLLARGDRRDLVIIDSAGGIHSPRRRLGVKAKELKEKWADLNHDHLPTVEQVRQERDANRFAHALVKDKEAESAIETLHQKRQEIEAEIAQLEKQVSGELGDAFSADSASFLTEPTKTAVTEPEGTTIEPTVEVKSPSNSPKQEEEIAASTQSLEQRELAQEQAKDEPQFSSLQAEDTATTPVSQESATPPVDDDLDWVAELTEADRCELAELLREWEEEIVQSSEFRVQSSEFREGYTASKEEQSSEGNTPPLSGDPIQGKKGKKEKILDSENLSHSEEFGEKNAPEKNPGEQHKPSPDKEQSSPSQSAQTDHADQRELIETYLPYYTERERRRLLAEKENSPSKSDQESSEFRVQGSELGNCPGEHESQGLPIAHLSEFGSRRTQLTTYMATTRAILSLTGEAAIAERDCRLQAAQTADKIQADTNDRRSLTTYLTELGQRLKEKGRSAYRQADRYLAERLAKLNYSKAAIRHALLRGSPELMEQIPSQRRSYIERLLTGVIDRCQRQKPMMETSRTQTARLSQVVGLDKQGEQGRQGSRGRNNQPAATSITSHLKKTAMDKDQDKKAAPKPESPGQTFSDPPIESVDLPLNPAGVGKSLVKGGLKKAIQRLWGKREKPSPTKDKQRKPERPTKEENLPQGRQHQPEVDRAPTQPKQRQANPDKRPAAPRTTRQQAPPNRQHRDEITQGQQHRTTQAQEKANQQQQHRFQQTTREVMKGSQPTSRPQGEGRPQQQSPAVDAKNRAKQQAQESVWWLKHDRTGEVSQRLDRMLKSQNQTQDKSDHQLTREQQYQQLLIDGAKPKFGAKNLASKEADLWVTKGVLSKIMADGSKENKNAQEVGQDMAALWKGMAENSLNAPYLKDKDQYQYASAVMDKAWKEVTQPTIHERQPRSLDTSYQTSSLKAIYQAYTEAKQTMEVQLSSPSPTLER